MVNGRMQIKPPKNHNMRNRRMRVCILPLKLQNKRMKIYLLIAIRPWESQGRNYTEQKRTKV